MQLGRFPAEFETSLGTSAALRSFVARERRDWDLFSKQGKKVLGNFMH